MDEEEPCVQYDESFDLGGGWCNSPDSADSDVAGVSTEMTLRDGRHVCQVLVDVEPSVNRFRYGIRLRIAVVWIRLLLIVGRTKD